jgi:hypothetical protein
MGLESSRRLRSGLQDSQCRRRWIGQFGNQTHMIRFMIQLHLGDRPRPNSPTPAMQQLNAEAPAMQAGSRLRCGLR